MDQSDDDDLRFSDLEENSDADDNDDVQEKPVLGLNQSDSEKNNTSGSGRVQGMRHLTEMSSALGLDKFKEKSARRRERKKRAKAKKRAATSAGRSAGASDPSRMVQTEASRLLGLSGEVDVVEHLDGRRKRKRKEEEEEEETVGTAKGSSRKEVSMKQARFDVYKFGVSGFGRTEREDAEVASLVRLGAKPPKKKRVDYPQLKEERKAERERERERREMERLSGLKNVVGRGKAKGKEEKAKATKKKGSDSLQAKVGKFNGGMLRLSAKDILKIKSGRK